MDEDKEEPDAEEDAAVGDAGLRCEDFLEDPLKLPIVPLLRLLRPLLLLLLLLSSSRSSSSARAVVHASRSRRSACSKKSRCSNSG